MTAIVGLKDKGKVWIGGDSCISEGDTELYDVKVKKVFKKNNILFGVAGSLIANQELLHRFDIPKYDTKQDPYKYLMGKFIPAFRHHFDEYLAEDDKFWLMLGLNGKLFQMDYGYSIVESSDFTAVGCGEGYTMGALYATPQMNPQKRIKLALEAAEKYNVFVRKPFKILSV